MERNDKHSAREDDALKHEVEGLVRSGRSTHAEEWKDPEPSGEDQPDADRVPDGTLTGGTPHGMSEEDVQGRSELATYLGKGVYPANRQTLEDTAAGNNAPDRVLDLLRQLPDDREFESVSQVWAAVGGGVEDQRY